MVKQAENLFQTLRKFNQMIQINLKLKIIIPRKNKMNKLNLKVKLIIPRQKKMNKLLISQVHQKRLQIKKFNLINQQITILEVKNNYKVKRLKHK